MYHDITAAAERGRQNFQATAAERGRPAQQARRPAAARRFSLNDGSEAVIGPARGVGIARYIRLTADPQAAEVDIVVVDDWQRRGLGTALLAQLPDRARRLADGRPFIVRDGSEVLIRRVQAVDAPLLAEAFSRRRSRWPRFRTTTSGLAQADIRCFTQADHYDHEALVAVDQMTGRGVGVVRYIRHVADPRAAEIAVTVIDDWQRLGLGTVLLAQLSVRARAAGIRKLTALVAAENDAAIRLLRRADAEFVRRDADTVEYDIPVGPVRTGHWARQLGPPAPGTKY
jgi:GNAT superfamily N-acetyltransferase